MFDVHIHHHKHEDPRVHRLGLMWWSLVAAIVAAVIAILSWLGLGPLVADAPNDQCQPQIVIVRPDERLSPLPRDHQRVDQ